MMSLNKFLVSIILLLSSENRDFQTALDYNCWGFATDTPNPKLCTKTPVSHSGPALPAALLPKGACP